MLGPGRALGPFLHLPRRRLRRRIARRLGREHMRMPRHHLVGNHTGNPGEIEPPTLLRQPRVVHDLKQ
jgi:hypothetical protein